MPFRGVPYSVENRVITTWYPGNPIEATQQLLGPKDVPSTWEGEWNTTRLGSTPAKWSTGGSPTTITRASSLAAIVDDLARSSALLRVTWSTDDNRKLVREGRISVFTPTYDRMDDVRWSITFDWTSRGVSQKRVVTFRGEDLEAAQREALATMNELASVITGAAIVTINSAVPTSASELSLGDLEALAAAPSALLGQVTRLAGALENRIGRVASLATTVAAIPSTLAGQAADAAKEVTATITRVQDELGRIPPDGLTNVSGKPSRIGQAAAYYGTVQRAAQQGVEAALALTQVSKQRRAASLQASRKEDRTGPADVVARHIAREGETFASLSQQFYGTPERGAVIAKANGFPGYQVAPPAGRNLVIPVLSGGVKFSSPRV
jgi:hypothetical protein